MLTADEILRALRERKITQKRVAEVLGVEQPNAAALWAKKRKPRQLGYDEGLKLIEVFGLDPGQQEAPRPAPSARAMIPILSAVLRRAPKGDLSDRDVRRLAEALEYGLGLATVDPANEATLDALAVAARAAADRFREERPST
jgi:transcriptional regulator with XRE-family HTH domain